MSEAPLLQVQHLTRTFAGGHRGQRLALRANDEIDLTLGASGPEIVSLVGESGSGKSTLARILLGLDRPSVGRVLYHGVDVAKLRGRAWWQYRREVQAVFQDPYGIYNPFYRVDRVLDRPVRHFRLAASRREADEKIDGALRAVDLRPQDVLGRFPHQLSGGERQRIMLARLYLIRPRLIIADEPVSMIDAALRTMFLNILLDFRDQGISCLFITHNLQTAYYLGGRCLVLYRGRMVESGSIDEVLQEPAHPYTRVLVSSIPSPDPTQRWSGELPEAAVESGSPPGPNECAFAQRCPHVMERCRSERPSHHRVSGDREAACLLFEDVVPAAKATDLDRPKPT